MELPVIYFIAGGICVLAFILGFTDKKFLFLRSQKACVMAVAVCGFVMCTTGLIGVFITKAPAHPLSIAGYVLGAFALIAALSQILNWKLPLIKTPKRALVLIAACIAAKVLIARLYILL